MHFFDEVKSYVGFDEDDITQLKRLAPLLEHCFPKIVERFYDALHANPRTEAIFSGPEQVERLRTALEVWLREIFHGPYDAAYFKRRERIGLAHVRVGLLPQFMFGAMNIIRRGLVTCILEQKVEDPVAAVTAIERVLDIELTIMLQTYWNSLMEAKLQVPAALAAGLAHEIRNPLNAIGLNLTLVERRLRKVDGDTQAITKSIEGMRVELNRIRGLTSEILDFAKPVDIHPTWFKSADMLEQLQVVHGPVLEVSNIAFKVVQSGHPQMYCDRDRVYQVLVNLVKNSVEAIEDEGAITIKLDTTDYGTVLEVHDSGPGMAPGLKYRVFDLFFTTKASGTGMGLPMVRKIVEAHGGSVDINSVPGRGTTFIMSLPRPSKSPSGAKPGKPEVSNE